MDSDGIEKARYERLACSHGDKRLFSLPQTKLFLHYDPEEKKPTTTVEQERGGSRPPRSQVGNQTKGINYLRLK